MSETCGKKQTIANEVLDMLSIVADRSTSLAQRVEAKLTPIMRHGDDQREEVCQPPMENYPPLFDEYRGRINFIEKALDDIEECLRMVEV
jgi:hypothetical protein